MSSAAKALADPEIKAEWEREAAAVLKRLGYPVVEGANSASSLLPRVEACLTRRLSSLSEFLVDLDKAVKAEVRVRDQNGNDVPSIFAKILGCTLFTLEPSVCIPGSCQKPGPYTM